MKTASFPIYPVVCAVALVASVTVAGAAESAQASETALQRGRYLVNTMGCNDCHTPLKPGARGPEPDMSRMLSGHPESLVMPPAPALSPGPWQVVASATGTAWSGPWGVSFTSNLTPDRETGLGNWSLNDFTQTLRKGRHLGVGREILPPMPIPYYKQLKDEDIAAIWAYLRSVPAVRNRVPAPLPPPSATKP